MIKLLQPHMPAPDELAPYLRRMHNVRQYSNNGPLVKELAALLSSIVDIPCAMVANATQGLELALKACGIGRDHTVLTPSMTFVATGLAIRACGAIPMLTDVDQESWLLTPKIARAVLMSGFRFDVVMPVAAFGLPVDAEGWAEFSAEYRIPVIIDAAGALTVQRMEARSANVHIVYSLHATKFIGAGEGGVVASNSSAVLAQVARLASFLGAGATNAKMSEYHAAVALANLGNRGLKHAVAVSLAGKYLSMLPSGVKSQKGSVMDRSLFVVMLPKGFLAYEMEAHLKANEIESKQWYRPFLHENPSIDRHLVTGPLGVTQDLAERMIGLPFHFFMTHTDVEKVINTMREVYQ